VLRFIDITHLLPGPSNRPHPTLQSVHTRTSSVPGPALSHLYSAINKEVDCHPLPTHRVQVPCRHMGSGIHLHPSPYFPLPGPKMPSTACVTPHPQHAPTIEQGPFLLRGEGDAPNPSSGSNECLQNFPPISLGQTLTSTRRWVSLALCPTLTMMSVFLFSKPGPGLGASFTSWMTRLADHTRRWITRWCKPSVNAGVTTYPSRSG
jgi:hypothetical protein